MTHVLYVPVSGRTEKRTVDVTTLEDISGLVGGWLEAVTLDTDVALYCDEEAKLVGKPVNMLATQMAYALGWTRRDVLAGDVVFLGRRGPAETDVPERIVALVDAVDPGRTPG